ncbi:hypothetical protein F4861DRAFT_516806 [Xylaria intraflava]|nr:hypothetical protein F4861DRAFT_516806 [Xylaria intraflava]
MAVGAAGTFFIVLFVLLVVAGIGWVVFTQLRARRLGLPSPPLSSYIPFARSSHQSSFGSQQPSAGGIRGWISNRFRSLKNPRSAAGAYEPSAAGRRGFGPLDPDEAWDARVGHETYGVGPYHADDQELEDRAHHNGAGGPYSGSGYQMNLANDGTDENRGRNPTPRPSNLDGSASRTYAGGQHNPFDDSAAEPSNISMRGVSPRPFVDTHGAATAGLTGGPIHDSPTSVSERRSVFREDV